MLKNLERGLCLHVLTSNWTYLCVLTFTNVHVYFLGLKTAPSNRHLEEYIERINASRPQCPVGLNTLVLPKRNVKIDKSRQPYVYLACGHVHGSHEWKNDTSSRTCPMCMKVRKTILYCCRLYSNHMGDNSADSNSILY